MIAYNNYLNSEKFNEDLWDSIRKIKTKNHDAI